MRLENEKPLNKFLAIEQQCQSLLTILVCWAQYTEIIYMSDHQIEVLIGDNTQGQNIEEEREQIKHENEEIKKEHREEPAMERLKELMKIRKLKEKDIYKELKEAGPTEEDDPIPFHTRDRKSSDFDSSRTDTERTASEASEREREEIEDEPKITTNEDLIKFKEKLFSDLGINKADADELNRLFERDDFDPKDTEDGTEIRDPMSNPIIDEIGDKEVKDLFRSDAFENVLKHSKDLYDFKKPKVHFQCDVNDF